MGNLKKYQLSIYFTASVVAAICIILIIKNLRAKTLYFIHDGPTAITGTPQVPFETRIYSFDEGNGELKQVWTLGENKAARKIGVYPTPGTIVIVGDRDHPKELYIFQVNDISKPILIRPDTNIYIGNFHFYDLENKPDEIAIPYRGLYSLDGISKSYPENGSGFGGKIRLCGGRAFGYTESDLMNFYTLPQGKMRGSGTNYEFDAVPVPDSIVQKKWTRGWNLIANEPGFYALSSVPELDERTLREILVYNRLKKKWSSFLIIGCGSTLRLVNNCLVGEILNGNREFDYYVQPETASGPKPKESVILIYPMENRQQIIELDVASVILWVEKDIVYYRSLDLENAYLCKARIENDSLVDKEMLSTDPLVRFFRWGIRGSSGE